MTIKIGLVGFGKSFVAWNLAGMLVDSLIYADARAPFRTWNQTEKIAEKWSQIEEAAPKYVLIDHEESEEIPDVILHILPPDKARITQFNEKAAFRTKPTIVVLNGYESKGVPWPFPPDFEPVTVIPWDMRQPSTISLGIPLTKRDRNFQRYFIPIMEAIARVVTV